MAKRMPFTVRTVALACAFAAAMLVARAQTPVPAVAVDADDIGGVVVGPGGPEAGVWVIAETAELGQSFGRSWSPTTADASWSPICRKPDTSCGCAATD